MKQSRLIHQKEFILLDQTYHIRVYSRDDGKIFAETVFDEKDIIVSDGDNMDEVLLKHERLIPLAVDSRKILRGIPSPAVRLYQG